MRRSMFLAAGKGRLLVGGDGVDVGRVGGERNIDTGLLTVKLQWREQTDRLVLPAVAEDVIH